MGLFLDIIILSFIVLSGIRGFLSGFIEQVGQTIGLVISILVSFKYSVKFSEYYIEKVPFEIGTFYFLTFSVIFSLTLILSRIILKTIQIIFLNQNNDWMNKSLGAVFGFLKGIIIITMLIWFVSILPLDKWNSHIKKYSKLAKYSYNIKLGVVEFFHWDENLIKIEAYFKNITQP